MLALTKSEQVLETYLDTRRATMESGHEQYLGQLLEGLARNHPYLFSSDCGYMSWQELIQEYNDQLGQARSEWKRLEDLFSDWDKCAELVSSKEELIQRIRRDWLSELSPKHPFPPKPWDEWVKILQTQDWCAMKDLLYDWWQGQMTESAKQFASYWAPFQECRAHILLRWQGLCLCFEEMKSKMLEKVKENSRLKGADKITIDLVQIQDQKEKFFQVELDIKQHGFRKLENIAQYYQVPPHWEWILSGIGRVSRSVVLHDYVWPEGAHLKLIHVQPYIPVSKRKSSRKRMTRQDPEKESKSIAKEQEKTKRNENENFNPDLIGNIEGDINVKNIEGDVEGDIEGDVGDFQQVLEGDF